MSLDESYELVWENDYYYLIAVKKGELNWRHYRVDRILEIRVMEGPHFKRRPFDISSYMKKLFHMYSGKITNVKLRFDKSLLNVCTDKFGPKAEIREVNNQFFDITFSAAESEGLIRWILTWGKECEVLEPKALREKIKVEANQMFLKYQ